MLRILQSARTDGNRPRRRFRFIPDVHNLLERRRLLATSLSPLVDRLAAHAADSFGDAGVGVVRITPGGEVTSTFINPDIPEGTSSTIKSGIGYALLRKVDADPDDDITLDTMVNSGSQYGDNNGSPIQPDQDYSYAQLAAWMINFSDNWSTNRLIDEVGMDVINSEFENLGLVQTHLDRYMTGTGAPSAHGTTGPGGDYRAGYDNLTTPREYTTFLRLVHENDGLISEESYDFFFDTLNGSGSFSTYYNASNVGILSDTTLATFDVKAGSNTWNGSPGDFAKDPTLGSHFQRSEAGRIVFDNGDIVFYAGFVDNASFSVDAVDALQNFGYEIGVEYAGAPVTYTPDQSQLDDGRVIHVHGTAAADTIVLNQKPGDSDNLQITVNGDLIADIDTYQSPFADIGGQMRVQTVRVWGYAGADVIDVPSWPTPSGNIIPLVIGAGEGNDDVNFDGSTSVTVHGEAGDDTISTGSGNDTVSGGSGADVITTLAGGDFVIGGSLVPVIPGVFPVVIPDGGDTINVGLGDDTVYGDNLDPLLPTGFSFSGGGDSIVAGGGDDLVYGQSGDDTISGGTDHDTIDGGAGDDTIDGGSGDDDLDGGDDSDLVAGGTGNDTLDGGAGSDQLVGDLLTSVATPASAPGDDVIYGGDGDDAIIGDDGSFLPLYIDATGGNDTIRGGAGNDLVFSQGGADLVEGNGGDDALYTADGDDVVVGGTTRPPGLPPAVPFIPVDGSDYVNAGAGDDLVLGDNRDPFLPPTISPAGAGDTLDGGDGDDTMYGQAGDDAMDGGNGHDLLDGGVGDDALDGGNGDDTLVGNLGLDTLEGGDGDDALVGGNLDVNAPDVSTDHLDGGAGGDILRGDSGPADRTNVATVGGGNDVLVGGGGNDLLLAGPGRDWADGGGGNDFFRGGDGDDFFSGGDGDDVGLGEGGDDALQGQAGRDVLIGGRNLDHLDGGADDDLLIGGVTSHDANDAAILSVAAEWNSARSYAARTANLRGVINPEFANRLNGNVYLTPNVTVLIDGAIDILAGGADVDWFFRLGEEIVADAAPGERIL